MDHARKKQIEQEYRDLKAEGEEVTMPLHQNILANWKAHSPKMWAELQKAGPGIADKLAFTSK